MKILIACLPLILCAQTFAQRFQWATTGGYATPIANSFAGAVDIAQDPQGNVYTMDSGNLPQQCQGDTLAPFGNTTTFIYKFNDQGELLFMNRVGASSGGSFTPFNIETDDQGNLYLLGQPNGVGSIIVNNDTVPALGNTNQLIKLDSQGNFVWKINTGFASNGQGCMLQYSNGHIYYQSGALTISKIDTNNTQVASISASYYSSPTSSNSLIFKGSSVFSNGDLVFAAYSRGVVAFGTDTLYNTGNPFSFSPVLFLKCDTSLNLLWAKYASNARDPDRNFIPVAVGTDNNVYAAIQATGQLTVGSDTILNTITAPTAQSAILKLNGETGNGVWARSLITDGVNLAWCMQKAFDGSGIFIGGGYTFNSQFGSIPLITASFPLPFISKIGFNGDFLSAFNYLQTQSQTDASCLLADGNGNYYVGGKLPSSQGAAVFSCTPAATNRGFYLGKFSELPDSVPTPLIVQDGPLLTASPNFSSPIQWFLNGEEIPGATGQTYLATENGSYSVSYSYETGCVGTASSEIQEVIINSIANFSTKTFQVYPNPTNEFIYIETYSSEPIQLIDLSGRIILEINSINSNSKVISLSSLAAGIYIVKQERNSLKLIKF